MIYRVWPSVCPADRSSAFSPRCPDSRLPCRSGPWALLSLASRRGRARRVRLGGWPLSQRSLPLCLLLDRGCCPSPARLVTAMALEPGLHPNLCSWSSSEQTWLNAPSGLQETRFLLEPLVTETAGT